MEIYLWWNGNITLMKWKYNFDEMLISGCSGSCHFKWKCHFDEMFITGCTGSCHSDNFQSSQRWKFHQNDISVSVYIKGCTVHCHSDGNTNGKLHTCPYRQRLCKYFMMHWWQNWHYHWHIWLLCTLWSYTAKFTNLQSPASENAPKQVNVRVYWSYCVMKIFHA